MRRLVYVGVLAAGLLTGAHAAAGAEVLQLAVAVGGDDTGTCAPAAPCASVQHAIDVAGDSPAVVRVGDAVHDYDGVTVGAGQHVSIVGTDVDPTTRTRIGRTDESATAVTNAGWLSISNMYFYPGGYAVAQSAGSLRLVDDLVESADGVEATGGSVTIANTTFRRNVASPDVYSLNVAGADVNASNTEFDEAVDVSSGSLHGESVVGYNTPHFLRISGGSVAVDRSELSDMTDAVTVTGTGIFTATRSTFDGDDPAVTVNSAQASAELISDTVADQFSETQLNGTAGVLALAGTAVVGPYRGPTSLCTGTILDGGWNLATDSSCGFTARGSHDDPTLLTSSAGIHPAAYEGGLPDRSPTGTSPMVDHIPVGATASYDPAISLCVPGSYDQRGQIRPVHGRCDVGSVEVTPTVLSARLIRRVTYPQPVTMSAAVAQVAGTAVLERLVGKVGFPTYWGSRCLGVPLDATGTASCTYRLHPGTYRITATFQPRDAFHASHATRTVVVDRAPTRIAVHTSPAVAGRPVTLTANLRNLRAEGGYAQVTVDGHASPSCHRLDVDPQAACVITRFAAGTHTVRLSYPGDPDRLPATVVHRFRVRA